MMKRMMKRMMMVMAMLFAVVTMLALTGCGTLERGGGLTGSAGHSPLISLQPGVHLGSSNMRPIQSVPDGELPTKIAESVRFGDVTVTTETTISSGDGGVETSTKDSGDQSQEPDTDVSPTIDLTP